MWHFNIRYKIFRIKFRCNCVIKFADLNDSSCDVSAFAGSNMGLFWVIYSKLNDSKLKKSITIIILRKTRSVWNTIVSFIFCSGFPLGTMLDYDLNARCANLHNRNPCILQLNAKMHKSDDLDDLDHSDFIFVNEFRIVPIELCRKTCTHETILSTYDYHDFRSAPLIKIRNNIQFHLRYEYS